MRLERLLSPAAHVAAFVVLGAALADTARAQVLVGGAPGGNVFLGRNETADETLSLSLSLFSGFDDVRGRSGESDAGSGPPRAILSSAASRLAYMKRSPRGQFEAIAASAAFGGSREEISGASHMAGMGLDRSLTPRIRLQARFSTLRQPFYQFTPFSSASPSARFEQTSSNTDHAVTADGVVFHTAVLDLSARIDRRSSVGAEYSVRYSDFLRRSEDLLIQDARLGVGRQVSRNSTISVGLRARLADRRFTGRRVLTRVYGADVGVSKDWRLSPSRTTTFSLNMGPSLVDDTGRQSYNLFIQARLRHPVGEKWDTNAIYRHRTEFIEGVREPLITDSATVYASGPLARRIGLQTSAGFARGRFFVGAGQDDQYVALTGTLGISVGLTQHLAMYGTGFYYHYALGNGSNLVGLPVRFFDRYGVGTGVTWRIPLLARRNST